MRSLVSLSSTACWVCCRRTIMREIKPDGARLVTGGSTHFYSNATIQRKNWKGSEMHPKEPIGSCQVQSWLWLCKLLHASAIDVNYNPTWFGRLGCLVLLLLLYSWIIGHFSRKHHTQHIVILSRGDETKVLTITFSFSETEIQSSCRNSREGLSLARWNVLPFETNT